MECLLGYIGLSTKVKPVPEPVTVFTAAVTSRNEIFVTGGFARIDERLSSGTQEIDGKTYYKFDSSSKITLSPTDGFKVGDVLAIDVCSSGTNDDGVTLVDADGNLIASLHEVLYSYRNSILKYTFTQNTPSVSVKRISSSCYIYGFEISREVSPDVTLPESGLYVDALPDISYTDMVKLTEKDQSVEELWAEIEQRTVLKFRTLFTREVNKSHRISDQQKCECLICNNKTLLATALWYLLGAEVMYVRATNSRLNTYTTLDHTKAKDMRDEFMRHFEDELETAVLGIDVHASTCFEDPHEPEEVDIIRVQTPVI